MKDLSTSTSFQNTLLVQNNELREKLSKEHQKRFDEKNSMKNKIEEMQKIILNREKNDKELSKENESLKQDVIFGLS